MRDQSGAVATRQLQGLGFSDDEISGLLAAPAFRRRHRGVYVDARAPEAARTKLFAALLTCNESAFLSHRTALALHRVRSLNLRAIEVTVVSGHTPVRDGLLIHRTSVEPLSDEVRTKEGLRVASPAHALIDVAAQESERELGRLLGELARRRLLDLDRIRMSIARRSHVAGIPKLALALERYQPPGPADASGFERDFAAWLDTHPEIPTPQRNVRLHDRWELDFFWPEHRLVVETDGDPYHRTPDERERDHRKDTYLQRHDIKVVRITGFRFEHDRSGILDDLRALTKHARAA